MRVSPTSRPLIAALLGSALGLGSHAAAQSIDLRLGVTFADPADNQSGGTFEVAATSGGGAGIAGLVTRLTGIELDPPASPVIETPATFNWLTSIPTSEGNVPPILDRGDDVTEILLGQDLSIQSALVYDIGGGAGTPGNRPADPFGAGFTDAAVLLTGSFLPGSVPAFSTVAGLQTAGNVFLVDTGPDVTNATISTSVVSNLTAIPGDYDGNGSVGPEDLAVWASDYGSTVDLAADGNGDSVVDAADYTVWRDNLPAAAAAVPEPHALTLAALAALAACRRGRR